ncbi:MAG: ABC transporter ATP-binding protein [Oscillospiraceae bacterium]|nr:ABC transporter ATP-binding protein [Oscillospiraceae bacterium]
MDERKTVLTLDNVSVQYRKNGSLSTAELIKGLFRRDGDARSFWALRNLSFSLQQGDMLGVIGRNGAGKSTTMKAVSGTLTPAGGTITREGSLCALLELGAGFDKEMTVKENVYLRGALLGYSKEFIDSKYDEIIDFADMREFEDNPFRTLSSGMKSRIAFSIASMVEPDIIILDEVFAVGDGDFKKKSQERMQEIIGSGRTTALIVSHNLSTVRKQCNKVLWLNKGRMVMFGEANLVCDEYKKFLDTGVLPETESLKRVEANPRSRLKKSSKKRLLEAFVYIMLILSAVLGGFVWSQYDMLKSYAISRNTESGQILTIADNYHSRIRDVLSANTSNWDYAIFEDAVPGMLSGELSYREVAKEVLRSAGNIDSEGYRLTLAAAEIEAVKYVHMARLDAQVEQMRADFEAQPEGKYRSLMVYSYLHCDEFYRLEEACDDDMQDIIQEIRAELRKTGQPEELADQVWNAYKTEKVYLLSYYCVKLR